MFNVGAVCRGEGGGVQGVVSMLLFCFYSHWSFLCREILPVWAGEGQ